MLARSDFLRLAAAFALAAASSASTADCGFTLPGYSSRSRSCCCRHGTLRNSTPGIRSLCTNLASSSQ